MGGTREVLRIIIFSVALVIVPLTSVGFELQFRSDGDDALNDALQNGSLLTTAQNNEVRNSQEILAGARADYQQLLGILYRNGYYSGTISILIDGQEAATLPPFFSPKSIDNVSVRVRTGDLFKFGRIGISPLAEVTNLPEGFTRGEPARSTVIVEAVESAIGAWREAGHAKAKPSSQSVVADHARKRLDASVTLEPGPLVYFGSLDIEGAPNVDKRRIRQIAGLRRGAVFSPTDLERTANRLRATGTFRSVALSEGETIGPDGAMDIAAQLVEEKPRRFGFGAEISSLEGAALSAYWMHRNILGGAERLRFDASIGGLGSSTSGIDQRIAAHFSRPGTTAPANTLNIDVELAKLDEPEFTSRQGTVEVGIMRRLSDRVEYGAGVRFRYSDVTDDLGDREFTHLSFPIEGRVDSRDTPLNPTKGYYLAAEIAPYLGLNDSASGMRIFGDGRAYLSFGDDAAVTLAGRAQIGSVVGSGLRNTPPDLLFFSGGGGTVRGQPYQSLSVDLGGNVNVGGRSFLGLSGEARIKVFDRASVVVFADAGFIGAESTPGRNGEWHSGAGLGIRYETGVGPIRLDVAAPVSGNTGDGIQVYVGIGQAF